MVTFFHTFCLVKKDSIFNVISVFYIMAWYLKLGGDNARTILVKSSSDYV